MLLQFFFQIEAKPFGQMPFLVPDALPGANQACRWFKKLNSSA